MKLGFGSSAEKNGVPRIDRIAPGAAIPGGEITLMGSGFAPHPQQRPIVKFGEAEASLALVSADKSGQQPQQSGFAGTIFTAKADPFAWTHMPIDSIENGLSGKTFGNID